MKQIVVLTAANGWDKQRMADPQLALALSHHIRILYVDPPSPVHQRIRTCGLGGLRPSRRQGQVAPAVTQLVPLGLPGVSRRPIAAVNRHLVAWQITWCLRRLAARPRAIIDANALTPTLGLIRASTLAYWAQDDFVAMAPLVGVPAEVYQRSEAALVRAADVIIAANPEVAESIRSGDREVALIPFGCDAALFAPSSDPAATDVSLPGRLAVLMGTINERLDLGLLESVADAGVSLLIIGPLGPRFSSPRFEALADRPNVQWLGRRELHELPSYLSLARVGLLPYNHSAFNRGSFPLKTLEYLAAGLPVVATDLPATRWLNCPDVRIADDPGPFAAAVQELLAEPDIPGAAARRSEFASNHTWATRAAEFAHALNLN